MHVQQRSHLLTSRVWWLLMVLSWGTCLGAAHPDGQGASPGAATVTLLYHQDAEVRMSTIRALAAGRDTGVLDDLLRAYSIEVYTPVWNVYEEVLRQWTGQKLRGSGAWKSWLQAEVNAGRLTLDYQPIVPAALDPNQRARLDPLALQLGPEHFAHFAEVIRSRGGQGRELWNALRYMVANDHLEPVREFLGGECLSRYLAGPGADLTPVIHFLGCVANPSPLRERINEQVRRCLDSDDATILANTLRLLAGPEGAHGFDVPGVLDRVRTLLASPHPAVAVQAQRAMLRIDPDSLTSGAIKAPRATVTFLYDKDPETRITTIRILSAGRDADVIDDLIRAFSVESYTPVRNVYNEVLRRWSGRVLYGPGAWKSWLQAQIESGKLAIDYRPVVPAGLDPNLRAGLDPLALRLGPEHFDRCADALRGRWSGREEFSYALRYMVANDHLDQVREFLAGEWLGKCLAREDVEINTLNFFLQSLANPGPLRDGINAQVQRCLESDDATLLANTLHMLAGVEGMMPGLEVPGVAERVRMLLKSASPAVVAQARRAIARIDPASLASQVSYSEAFRDLYNTLGKQYPCFALKGIDWEAVGRELLPRVESVKTDEEFGRLCLELVARLQDSHAMLLNGSAQVPRVAFPLWDGGFACLEDDQGRAVVYFVVPEGPAAKAGLAVGHIITHINDQPVQAVIEKAMRFYSTYVGYSSRRYLRYHAFRFFARQDTQDAPISLTTVDAQGNQRLCQMQAGLKAGYLPRLPVPIPGIADAGTVSWKKLEDDIGYIYVRRISGDLVAQLDRAVGALKGVRGLIVDVRGNSGGGFDAATAHLNFVVDEDAGASTRPRFQGPMALLIDERCISAGEGWASWFIARQRARVFGQTTAGASSRKTEYTLKNGLYKVSFPVKAYAGFLDRPIEARGLEPDVPLRPNAQDIAQGRDTVLLAAQSYLLTQKPNP
jgi:C-terminal processing protease CtpA/Prc